MVAVRKITFNICPLDCGQVEIYLFLLFPLLSFILYYVLSKFYTAFRVTFLSWEVFFPFIRINQSRVNFKSDLN